MSERVPARLGLHFSKEQWDGLCSLRPQVTYNPLPGVYSWWEWLDYQINLCADNAQDEARAACYAALREMHSVCNQANLDISRVRNGRIIETGAKRWIE